MSFFENIIIEIKEKYEKDENILAMLVTGSVARGEAIEGNDLDIILIAKHKIPFTEYHVGKSLVEVSGGQLENTLKGLDENPMRVYIYLDAIAIFDKGNNLQQLQEKAQQVLQNYKPTDDEKRALKKWLASVVNKVNAAKGSDDKLKVGFHVSNVIWKITEGLYMINNIPCPASTSAMRRVHSLKKLPANFEQLWKGTLLGNLEERTNATIELIQFVLKELK